MQAATKQTLINAGCLYNELKHGGDIVINQIIIFQKEKKNRKVQQKLYSVHNEYYSISQYLTA